MADDPTAPPTGSDTPADAANALARPEQPPMDDVETEAEEEAAKLGDFA